MKGKLLKVVASVFLILAVTSCASYSTTALKNLSPMLTQSGQGKNGGIEVVAMAFNKADCKKYLDRDVLSAGYQPVQLYIQNNSDKAMIFSTDKISLTCVSAEEVAEKVHTSTLGRVAAYTVGSLFLWPLIIPAVVDGIWSSQANDALDADFLAKTAKHQVIFPQSHCNKIIFIPLEQYQSNFSIGLVDGESNQAKVIKVYAI